MKDINYNTSLSVIATSHHAFDCINHVSKWWTTNIEGSSQKTNDVFTVSFGTTWKTITVSELIPDKKIVWRVTDCYMPWNKNKTEWTGTELCFDISEKENKTQIRFTHIGLIPQFECFEICRNVWAEYIQQSLLSLIITGKGRPDK